jgi:thiosulfate/3-mercaptopyruvate sulfurtransferase
VRALREWESVKESQWVKGSRQETLVSCQWVMENKQKIKLFEVSCMSKNDNQLKIPGAGFLDTNRFERESLMWNKVPDSEIIAVITESGIAFDTLVVLYSRENPLPAARILHIMLYIGVKDVRLMDGGLVQWQKMQYEVTYEPYTKFKSESSYGTLMFTRLHSYFSSID